jgi:hypothetical protein
MLGDSLVLRPIGKITKQELINEKVQKNAGPVANQVKY